MVIDLLYNPIFYSSQNIEQILSLTTICRFYLICFDNLSATLLLNCSIWRKNRSGMPFDKDLVKVIKLITKIYNYELRKKIT